MCDPLPVGKKTLSDRKRKVCQVKRLFKNNKILFAALVLTFFGLTLRIFEAETRFEIAQAQVKGEELNLKSPLFEEKEGIFDLEQEKDLNSRDEYLPKNVIDGSNELFAQKIYALVGDAPIKEMVPYISKRDDKVAAFLIGIAKKESSFGLASPSKDGKTCYNYWGYKGSAGRGTGMGYACFASAEEAVNIVGNRIEVLVEKNRSTPAKMVDTWKCGTSCKGDPGAPSWVSTVALYFDKLVEKNS
ncbi:MAG: hypothetical protein ACD_5C00206G0001 [uncultured bacterium]|nr:MAG: hypothetical protein ACD_5C00206G0001 [uncultured bacterium]